MHKISYNIGAIGKMQLSLNVVLKDDEDVAIKSAANNCGRSVLSLYTLEGNKYFKIDPRPYITIDISKSVENNNARVNLNRYMICLFISKLKMMIDGFKIKDLYYIQNNKLNLNAETAKNLTQTIYAINKTIKMVHAVVPDSEDSTIECEGILFMINYVDIYCTLTYNDLCVLYYELYKMDINNMTMQLINNYLIQLIGKNSQSNQYTIGKYEVEKKDDSYITPTVLPGIKTIPEI